MNEKKVEISNLQIAVLSDIHGNRWALEAVLNDINHRGIRSMVNLGDCLYGPLDPAGTAEILVPLNLSTVRGNEDRIITENSSKFKTSPTLRYVRECLNTEHLHWLETLAMTTVVYGDFFFMPWVARARR